MNKNYTAPVVYEVDFYDQGVLCLSPTLPEGSFEEVEREEFPW